MALETVIIPTYHSPPVAPRNHSRQSSSRRSFTAIPSSPGVESPRTSCPRDGDAFSYSPSHLSKWYISQELWNNLPATLQSTLAALQHSGAAVLTGFERLEQHGATADAVDAAATVDHVKTVEDDVAVQADDNMESITLNSPKVSMLRTMSDASSRHDSVCYPDSPSSLSPFSSRSSSPAPSMSASQTTSPISPICLTPTYEAEMFRKKRHHERRVTFPLEPRKAYYMTELTQLRTESLPRLRHSARKVDTEWYECKRLGAVRTDDIVEFEKWYSGKKATIRELDDKCQRLSAASDISPTGMGWAAP